jgi:hypothetical protein
MSEQDWIGTREAQAFAAPTSFPEGGPNSMMGEVLAVAFCRGVATATASDVKVIKGHDIGPLAELPCAWGRVVAFEKIPHARP